MSRSRGFTVPFVAMAVAVLAVALWALVALIDGQARRLRLQRDQVRLETAAATAEARVAYLMLTEPSGRRGPKVGAARFVGAGAGAPESMAPVRSAAGAEVREFVLDGRPYRLGGLVLRAQDEAGLLNLNTVADPALTRALELVGVAGAEALGAALADFTDGDDLHRLNGAEAPEYGRAGLPRPANAPLSDPAGAFDVLGWRQALTGARRTALLAFVTTAPPHRPMNLNTAPVEALRAALGLDERAAALVVAEREQRTLRTVEDIATLTGATLAEDGDVGGLPGRRLRLTIRFHDASLRRGLAYQSRLIVAPDGAERPFFWRRESPVAIASVTETGGRGRDADLEELPQSPDLLSP